MRVSDERLAGLREKHLRDAARLSRHDVLAGPHRELAELLAELAEHREREVAMRTEWRAEYEDAEGVAWRGEPRETVHGALMALFDAGVDETVYWAPGSSPVLYSRRLVTAWEVAHGE